MSDGWLKRAVCPPPRREEPSPESRHRQPPKPPEHATAATGPGGERHPTLKLSQLVDAPMNRVETADTLPHSVRRGDLNQALASKNRYHVGAASTASTTESGTPT